ncbi:hypothetical protein U9M48_035155 [Paspalum notatum var. saurae]|uniref:NB-ARC domain-containing protein n=1 Tax=Paspalum notatum var. saurae TaxID=547442 RepID=A0AAQ3X9Q8_PASNO
MLREQKHKGYYVLDKVRYLDYEEVNSISNPGECFPSLSSSRQDDKIRLTLDSVQNMWSLKSRNGANHLFLAEKGKPPGEIDLGVLPIIEQGKVGKRTLVDHVCNDIKVHGRFSQVVSFSGNKITEEKLGSLKDGGLVKHKNNRQNGGEMLVIVELDDGDVEERAWRRMFPTSRNFLPSRSRIIVTSISEKITDFGMTQAFSRCFCLEAHMLKTNLSWHR